MKRIRRLMKREKKIKSLTVVSPTVISELKKRNYTVTGFLGDGAYSSVICLRKKETHVEVAAKIVKAKLETFCDKELWPSFNHPNIIFLNETIFVKGFIIYLMPKMDQTLHTAFTNPAVTRNLGAFNQLKSCFLDIVLGLEYLHYHNICYVDLKSDNILLNLNMKAIICDFSLCFSTDTVVSFNYSSNYYAAPETCCSTDWIHSDALSHDIWTFGVMFLVLLTGSVTDIKYGNTVVKDWDNLFDLFYILLQEQIFFSWVQFIFGQDELVPITDLRLVLNLIRACMRKNPKDRPKMSTIFHHGLWSSEAFKMFHEDSMWLEDSRSSETNQEQDIKDYQFSQDELEDRIRNIKHKQRNLICHDLFQLLKRYFPRRRSRKFSKFEISEGRSEHFSHVERRIFGLSIYQKNTTSLDKDLLDSIIYDKLAKKYGAHRSDGIEKYFQEKLQYEALPFIDDDNNPVSKSFYERDSETPDAKVDHVHTSGLVQSYRTLKSNKK